MPTIPYTKQSWTDGSGGGTPISAARLTVIENGIYEVSLAPAVRVTHNTTQTINNITDTALAFNTEAFDTAAGATATHHDTVTNNTRLTCLYAGKYQIIGNAAFAANSTGYRALSIRLNGATVIGRARTMNVGGSDDTYVHVSAVYDLAVNDYVQLEAYQSSGAGLNSNNVGGTFPSFSMFRVA